MQGIKFHKNFYSLKGVKLAVLEFKDFFKCKIVNSSNYIEAKVELANGQDDPEKIINEFKNYALYASIAHDQI